MKKFLSVLLTLAMLMGIVFALPVTAFAEEGDGIEETYTYYLYNEAQWEEVYFYASRYDYGLGDYVYYMDAAEPGVKLEPSDINAPAGYDVYKVTVDTDYENIWFSNGAGDCSYNTPSSGESYNNNSCIWYNSLAESYGFLTTENGEWSYYYISDDAISVSNYYGYDEVVEIPEEINGVKVTTIESGAFWDVDSVSQIRIHKDITHVEGQIAGYCDNLSSFYIDPLNPVYEVRCNAIVEKTTNTLVQASNSSVIDAEDNIAIIGDSAFAYSVMESVDIPDTVTTIQDNAFNDCHNLQSIHIPASVTSIGYRAFAGCGNVTSITVAEDNEYYTDAGCNVIVEKAGKVLLKGCTNSTIPDYVEKIDGYAFESCSSYVLDTIPDSVTYIGESAFNYCYSITEVNIPASVTYIGKDAFVNCDDIVKITVDENNPVYYSGSSNAIIERETQTLILGCARTVIPQGVLVIGDSAFEGMTDLIKIDIPESVVKIDCDAFFNCTALRRAVIRNKDCEIIDWSVDFNTPLEEGADAVGSTISNNAYDVEDQTVIQGHIGSTAEVYASCAGRPFYDISKKYDTSVYFINSAGWENITAEAWLSNAEETKIKPLSVEKVEDIEDFDVYKVTFDDFYDSIIFSDGTGNEEALSPEEIYQPDWYYNWEDMIWYENLDELREGDNTGGGDDEYDYSGYYLIVDYADTDDDLLDVNPEEYVDDRYFYYDGETGNFRCDYYLYNGDKIKVVYFNGAEITEIYKPDGEDYYEITSAVEGMCTVYFNPDETANPDWSYGFINVVEYVCNHNYNSYGVCVDCYQLAPGVKAGLLGHRIVLDGYIAVEYYMVLSDEAVADTDSAMSFMVPNGNKKGELVLPVDYEFDNNGNDDVLSVGNNMYIFTCHISAKDIAGIIEAEFTTCGETIVIEDYSVKQYLEYILAEYEEYGAYEEELPLAKAMLNYGTAAQQYFDVNLGNLANNSDYMSDEDRVIAEVDFSSFAPTLNNGQAGVSYYGTALSLKSETAIKHYFYFENEEDVKNINIETSMNQVEVGKNGGYYEFKIKNLYAQNLDEMITLTIGDTTLTYSAFSFGYVIMNQEGNEELKTVLNAMHEFNVQAEIYSRTVD